MLYALGRPVALLTLLAALLLGLTAYGRVQAFAATRYGDGTPQAERRTRFDPRAHVDPLGAVAAVLAGVGWARPASLGPRVAAGRGRLAVVLLAGPATTLALAVSAAAAYRAVGGPGGLLALVPLGSSLTGAVGGLDTLPLVLLLATHVFVALTLLSVVPLPPLDGVRLLFANGPRTPGWRRAWDLLAERNWGAAVLLALLLLGSPGVLVQLLDVVAGPVLGLVA